MLKQTKKAFTLVELIIVITILAILATIGFMSYQSYTSDARNSKRVNDISSLQSKLEITVARNATSILSFGSGVTANQLVDFTAGSGTTLTGGTNYVAWDVVYTAFGVDAADFKDPNGTSYKYGAASTTLGNIYQFVATMEAAGDTAKQSLVKGVFLTVASDTAEGLYLAKNTGATLSWVVNTSITDFAY